MQQYSSEIKLIIIKITIIKAVFATCHKRHRKWKGKELWGWELKVVYPSQELIWQHSRARICFSSSPFAFHPTLLSIIASCFHHMPLIFFVSQKSFKYILSYHLNNTVQKKYNATYKFLHFLIAILTRLIKAGSSSRCLQCQIFGRLKQEDYLGPGVLSQTGQHSETLSQRKRKERKRKMNRKDR